MIVIGFATAGRKVALTSEQKKKAVYERYGAGIWEKMPKAEPGDWLYWKKEPGQTFEEYTGRLKGKKARKSGVIYLQPLGSPDEFDDALLEKVREFTSIYFNREVRLQELVPMPKKAYDKKRDQYNGSIVLKQLGRNMPKDALARVGITMADLYSSDLNFVFGLGSPQLKAGIYSFHRYTQTYTGHKKHNTLLRRVLKVVSHEIGHIFFINHCIFYECGMNGSNSLQEADSRPMVLCPVDEKKLRFFLGYDREERYRKLEKFYRLNDLKHDAQFIEKLLRIMGGTYDERN